MLWLPLLLKSDAPQQRLELQLTFDDGPIDEEGHSGPQSALLKILDELDKRKAKAAFFVIGKEVQSSRDAMAAIKDAGHIIGNHSWSHLQYKDEKGILRTTKDFTDDQIVNEFLKTHMEVRSAGYEMKYWRAPRLEQTDRIWGLIKNEPRLPYLSHADVHARSLDDGGATQADQMAENIRKEMRRWGNRRSFRLLFHVLTFTASALPAVLDDLVKDGNNTIVDFRQET